MNSIKYFALIAITTFSLNSMSQSTDLVALSQDLLTSLKMGQPISEYQENIANVPYDSLSSHLDTDAKKTVFWLNLYIGHAQNYMSKNELSECDKNCKKAKNINVAGKYFSLNDVLYKILLHSKSKTTGGKNMFASKWEKQLRVGYPDGRVLLALDNDEDIINEITYYEVDSLDKQLDVISLLFVQKYVYYKKDQNLLYVPKWIKKFKREFGSSDGIYGGLRRAEIIGKNDTPKIIYSNDIATFK